MRRTALGFLGGAAVATGALVMSPKLQFFAGGAMANAAYNMQSHYEEPEEVLTPQHVWEELELHNRLAAKVREAFPRPTPHPTVAMLVCMDSRIDTNELVGDTRHHYYIVRTAGSAMSPKEEEMLELAAEKGVKLIVVTRHSDCAAEKAAKDPALRAKFPSLVQAIDERDQRLVEFLARPAIAERIRAGKLLVKFLDIDINTERVSEHTDGSVLPLKAP